MSFLRKLRKAKSSSKDPNSSSKPDRGVNFGVKEQGTASNANSRSPSDIRYPSDTEVFIKSIPLLNLDQVNAIGEEVRNGNIVILDTEPMSLSKKQRIDLRRAVDQLRGLCREFGGDLAQLGESYYIVITPPFIKIAERDDSPEVDANTASPSSQ